MARAPLMAAWPVFRCSISSMFAKAVQPASQTPASPSRDLAPLRPRPIVDPSVILQRSIGNRATAQLCCETAQPALPALTAAAPGSVQRQLSIGATSDPLEHEADNVANVVMRTPETVVSRKCASCEEEEKEKRLQTKPATTSAHTSGAAPPVVHDALHSPGEPLDAASRQFFEPRFGRDLSDVRVHTGPLADDSAHAVDALAYTVGRDIVFAAGEYSPSSAQGRHLLAHELTHVLQQTGEGGTPMVSRAPSTPHCKATWTCAATPCDQPDVAGTGASTSWSLDLNIDTDVEKATDITSAADIGHTYVVFKESNGTRYSYGFYPNPSTIPDAMMRPVVWGCIVHPDTAHQTCVDYTETYTLTQQQYKDALAFAQASCRMPDSYKLYSNNCTTFAVDVAKKAGQSPPSPRGMAGYGMVAAPADNPNTLKEGYLDIHVPTWRFTKDSEIRDWVSTHDALPTPGKTDPTIAMLPTYEKVRLLIRLLEGYVDDTDVDAFEKICSSITTPGERSTVQTQVGPKEDSLFSTGQKARVHKALFGFTAAPAPGVFRPSPPPPR